MPTLDHMILRCSDIVRHHADSYAVAFPAGKVTQRGLLLCRLSPLFLALGFAQRREHWLQQPIVFSLHSFSSSFVRI